jgi:hypothetical protein
MEYHGYLSSGYYGYASSSTIVDCDLNHKKKYGTIISLFRTHDTRQRIIIIECYSGWNMEYHGYLSSGYYGYASSSSYACVDINPENLIGGEKNENTLSSMLKNVVNTPDTCFLVSIYSHFLVF